MIERQRDRKPKSQGGNEPRWQEGWGPVRRRGSLVGSWGGTVAGSQEVAGRQAASGGAEGQQGGSEAAF